MTAAAPRCLRWATALLLAASVLLLAPLQGCRSGAAATSEEEPRPRRDFRQVLPTVAFEMMHDSPTIDILDVRSLSERRAEGHISKSQSWPFDELKGGLAELEPLRRRTFLVYDSGAEGDDRAKRAVLLLRSEGWPEAVLLEGGLVLWRRYGFGVIGGTVD